MTCFGLVEWRSWQNTPRIFRVAWRSPRLFAAGPTILRRGAEEIT